VQFCARKRCHRCVVAVCGKAARATNVAAFQLLVHRAAEARGLCEIMYISMCGTGVGFSVESQNVQKLPQIKRQVALAAKER